MAKRKPASSVQQHRRPVHHVACYVWMNITEAQGDCLDTQEQRCRAMATVKGWPLPVVYRDDSGTTEYRPRLERLLRDVQAEKIDAVIISALDRLGRNTRGVLDLVEKLTARGTILVSCRENIDTSTPIGQFVLTLFAALVQLERDITWQRTKKGGRIPFGYKYDAGVITIDPQNAHTVRTIFGWDNEGMSLREIAEMLNKLGIPSPQKGGEWQHSSVKAILDNEDIYRGGFRGDSNISWPRILLEEGGENE